MRYRYAAVMEQGPRPDQEDCILIGGGMFQTPSLAVTGGEPLQEGTLFAVCDGMGGHVAGEKASRYVAEALNARFRDGGGTPSELEKALLDIQRRSETQLPRGSGTTVAGILADRRGIVAFNAGDSRVYQVTPQGGRRLTHDHSFVQGLVDANMLSEEAAHHHPYRSMITLGLGPAFKDAWGKHQFHLTVGPHRAASWYFLCTDGVTDLITDQDLLSLLEGDPLARAGELRDFLSQQPLRDNTSFLILAFEEV